MKNDISPKTVQVLKTIFLAMTVNHIFPNQATMKINPKKSHFVAKLTRGYNFEVQRSFRVFEKKIFLITENGVGIEENW